MLEVVNCKNVLSRLKKLDKQSRFLVERLFTIDSPFTIRNNLVMAQKSYSTTCD